MNSQAVSEFVQAVTGFGPVRAKSLRSGEEIRLTGAEVSAAGGKVCIESEQGRIDIALADIEQIILSPEKQKYFVHLRDGLVEVRPDVE